MKFTVSQKILDYTKDYGGKFFNSVNQPKEDIRIELNLPAGDFLVGYVGKFKTLGMEKGIKTMISAIPLLGKEIKIVFVGAEESEIKEYKNMANRLNALSQCLIINNQPYLKAVKYMKAMDALVIPFPNAPHYAFYASPLKLFEYMAAGRPIIASDLPALREILNDKNALFFKPEDVDDLARAVKMLKLSQTLCYHLSGQAFSDVKNYTWGARAKKILNFLP
ncbi:MAG: Glycosyl transferase group 1 [Candidatus Azambacteria bacterium GW2011_GWA2_42_62]|nr:MAG: Glycosyl transferase group 1 [Candidatus Azambacteria bacterium GW2011_GWA2_42_62]